MNGRNLSNVANITWRLYEHALHRGEAAALSCDGEKALNFAEFWTLVEKTRAELARSGFSLGDRVIVLAKIDRHLMILIAALFAAGITPVLLDPRLERSKWPRALMLAGTRRMIAAPRLSYLRFLLPTFQNFKILNIRKVVADRRAELPPMPPAATPNTHLNLATLTSGTTGEPKLIERSFAVLLHQQSLASHYLPPLSVDRHLTVYALAALQSLVDGAATFYESSHTPAHLCKRINDLKITRLSGPPSVLAELLEHLNRTGTTLPSLECVLVGGAPIPRWLQKKSKRLLPKARLWIVYGSTECEPISLTELMPEDSQPGYLVGPIVAELKLLKKNSFQLQGHDFFEVALQGPNLVSANENSGYETGDLARLDDKQNLWLVGRVSESIRGIPVALLEEPLERLDSIARVGIVEKDGRVGVFVETHDQTNLTAETQTQIRAHLEKWNLHGVQIQRLHRLPVDSRHRWKIQRRQLQGLL